jgi:pilus assembly protein CpaE
MKLTNITHLDLAQISVHAYVQDKDSEEKIQSALTAIAPAGFLIRRGGVREAIHHYETQKSPSVIIVDISDNELPLSDLDDLANVCPPETNVLVLGERDNVGLYRNLLASGVSDYLIKPLPADLLANALKQALGFENSTARSSKYGKKIGVFGCAGGVGASHITASLLDSLAQLWNRRTVVLDLQPIEGTIAPMMGAQLIDSLGEIFKAPERIDRLFLDRITQKIGNRMELLGFADTTDFVVEGTVVIDKICSALQRQFHFVLMDAHRYSQVSSFELLTHCDVRILILDRRISAIRDCDRSLKALAKNAKGGRNIIVLNNLRPVYATDIDIHQIEQAIGQKIDFEIPYDGRNFSKAALNAMPVSRNRGRAALQLKLLAEALVGSSEKKKNTHAFGPFLKARGINVWQKKFRT